jgi:A-macroglobulin TED domain
MEAATLERVTLPARRLCPLVIMLLVLVIPSSTFLPSGSAGLSQLSQVTSVSGANGALRWLVSNESSSGSYGAYSEHWTSAAAYALWLNSSSSPKALQAFSFLSSELNTVSSWFWNESGYGEADIPASMLYTLAATHNLNRVNMNDVTTRLLEFHRSDGGFRGYADLSGNVYESSVDTALSLRALVRANAADPSSTQSSIQFLLNLQNPDGSFNLTRSVASDRFYSQGPEPVSITALVILALYDASSSYGASESHVAKALNFLSKSITVNFTAASDHEGHVYAASLAALAFKNLGRTVDAASSIAFVLSQQRSDGAFADIFRNYSNALDTGWATIALEQVQTVPLFSPFLTPIAIIGIAVLVGVVAVLAVLAAYLVIRRRSVKSTVPQTGQERAR